MPSILWFRRDLRLTDHPALVEAAATGPVLPLVVLDPSQLVAAHAASRDYFLASVAALRDALDGRLVVRVGDPRTVVPAVAREIGADAVHASRDFGIRGETRDADVAARLQGVSLVHTGSQYVVAPGRVLKDDGTPFKVFTPFYRAWLRHGWRAPAATVTPQWLSLPSDDTSGFRPIAGLDIVAVEDAARARWDAFRAGGLQGYRELRDRPDLDHTSRLSAALRFGELHARTLLADLGDEPDHEKLRSEIAWREFSGHLLHHFPQTATAALNPRFDAMRWDTGAIADARFDAWRRGQTGFPIVDAGMRQLATTGWMHNRVRMVVASFLVKHLHLDWRRGADWFAERLIDFDFANNQQGWQWTAGCGADAAPFHRIFNPVLQGLKFDPDGAYVRAFVPELRHIPGALVHEPWRTTAARDAGYPSPIIDLGIERDEALARLREIGANSAD